MSPAAPPGRTGVRTPLLSELLSLQPAGEIRWGLARTRAMLESVGRPHMAYRSVHIGGTNGKGSVAAMVASVLAEEGRRVGLYTSPHLVDFAERIRIGDAVADADLMEACARRLAPAARSTRATFFEAATALAFLCFAETERELVVAEVGLGGRLDATNVLLPEVAAITQVAWDHAEYLGHTLAAIAAEKAGIAKPGIPLVLGRLELEAGRIVRRKAEEAGSPVVRLGYDAGVRRIRLREDGTELEYVGPGDSEPLRLRCPLLGTHQAWNAGLAALIAESLPPDLRPPPSRIERGIGRTRWPGRLQVERRNGRTWVFDVAHNPVAVEALAQGLTSLDLPGPIAMLIAILGDKPWAEMLPPLLALGDRMIFTVAPSSPPERRWDPVAVARAIARYPVEVLDDFSAALESAMAAKTIVVTGSHHTVGDAMKALGVPVGLLRSSHAG